MGGGGGGGETRDAKVRVIADFPYFKKQQLAGFFFFNSF